MTMRLIRDQDGSVFVETTIMLTIMLTFVLGSIDFLFALHQWNSAAKATQLGARIAAVSDPVAPFLSTLSAAAVSGASPPGFTPMPAFTVTCDGSAQTCTCTSGTLCSGMSGYNATAMQTIVQGRGSAACGDAADPYYAGMCDIYDRITRANVRVIYTQTGLGYVGRPGGPVPTVTVQLQNLPFRFFFLGGFNLQVPATISTVTGEDLSSSF
jgi:hypothetical protein